MSEAGPVFIVGAPRSGGALLFEVLSTLPAFSPLRDDVDAISSGNAPDRLTPADLLSVEAAAAIRAAYADRLHHHEQRILQYTERNALRVSFLAALYPEARFVCVHRSAPAAIGAARRDGNQRAEIATERWIEVTSILLDDLEALPHERWYDVSYAALTADPHRELARLCAFLGTDTPRDVNVPPPDQGASSAELQPYLHLTIPAADRAAELFRQRAAAPSAAPPPPASPEGFRAVATPAFPEILHDLGISLVVTTYQSNQLMLVRTPQRSQLDVLMRRLTVPMGVAVRDGTMAVGTRQDVIEYRRQARAGANDAVWVPARIHVTGFIRVHELVWAGEELWIVNTLFSTLCTLDPDYNFVPRWRPPFVTHLAAEDRCHLNGVAVADGRIRFVSMLGVSNDAMGWRANKTDGGAILDVDSGETIVRGLCMPHSPRWHDGRLWFLESGRGTLASVDPRTGAVTVAAALPGFARGLAFAGPYAFVGLSQVRDSNAFSNIPVVEEVKDRVCGVWIVDLRSGAVAAFMRFDGAVQEISDIQVLHSSRFPDLVDLQDERLATSVMIPEKAMRELVQ